MKDTWFLLTDEKAHKYFFWKILFRSIPFSFIKAFLNNQSRNKVLFTQTEKSPLTTAACNLKTKNSHWGQKPWKRDALRQTLKVNSEVAFLAWNGKLFHNRAKTEKALFVFQEQLEDLQTNIRISCKTCIAMYMINLRIHSHQQCLVHYNQTLVCLSRKSDPFGKV